MSAFGASPGYDYLSRVTAGYSGIASTAPDIKVARKTSSFPSIVTCTLPSGPTPNSKAGGGQKPAADTSDTAGTHQKLVLRKEEAMYSDAAAMACG